MPTETRTAATIPAWLIMRPDWATGRSGPLWTFCALALLADDDGKVKISASDLAKSLNTSTRSVFLYVDHLRRIGAVTRTRSAYRNDANTYTLHFDGPAESGA